MPEYPSLPGMRLQYDVDGTAGWFRSWPSNVLTKLTSSDLSLLNDEGNDGWESPSQGWLTLIFPEIRSLAGAWGNIQQGTVYDSGVGFRASPDTTNGVDGTWTEYQAETFGNQFATPGLFRTDLWQFTASNVRAAALWARDYGGSGNWVRNFHVYGAIDAGENQDRLQIWHPTLDQFADGTTLDFGSVIRTTSVTKAFRVKNLSPTLTATAPQATVEFLGDPSPSLATQVELSTDQSTWVTGSLTLPDLAPGAVSGLVYARYSPPANARLVIGTGRIRWAASGGWA